MKTEDLFKYGVTPKEGPAKGQRFYVDNISKDGVNTRPENGKDNAFFKHGTYDIWSAPKTLFEDRTIEQTWGNLKAAAEAAGIGDDTMLWHHDSFFRNTKAKFGLVNDEGNLVILIY